MFRPLAWTKTLALGFSSLLAITLVPPLMLLFIRGRLRPESSNPGFGDARDHGREQQRIGPPIFRRRRAGRDFPRPDQGLGQGLEKAREDRQDHPSASGDRRLPAGR
jgi:multidrug efflux pump subunit AcrB